MRSRISFRLIKTSPYILDRYGAGSIVRGKYVRPPPTPVPIEALITPKLSASVMSYLPEAMRNRKTIRIICNERLIESDNSSTTVADVFTYDNLMYRVFKVGNWVGVSKFTAYEAYAVQIEAKELIPIP